MAKRKKAIVDEELTKEGIVAQAAVLLYPDSETAQEWFYFETLEVMEDLDYKIAQWESIRAVLAKSRADADGE
jgi:hypothetical protein